MARTVLLGLIVVVFGAISSIAAPDSQPELAGMYQCNGVSPDGMPYDGIVEIAKIQGTYRVLWALSDDTAFLGVGLISNGVFAVSYFGGSPAVVVYKIDGDKLVGEWTMGGREGTVYAETLTKMAAGAAHPRPLRPPSSQPPPVPRRPATQRPASVI